MLYGAEKTMPDQNDYNVLHAFICPHCGHKWLSSDLSPTIHCNKCNRTFPNTNPNVQKT
jgi:hypothetical protein